MFFVMRGNYFRCVLSMLEIIGARSFIGSIICKTDILKEIYKEMYYLVFNIYLKLIIECY